MYICVVSGHVYMRFEWSCIFVLYVVVYFCTVSGRVHLCCKLSCIFVLTKLGTYLVLKGI
jgi:hypothetical protein